MGCLLGCFGGAKDRRQRNKVLPRDTKHSHGCSFSHQNDALSEQKVHGCSASRLNDALTEQKAIESRLNDALSEQKAIESSPIISVELRDDKPEEKSSSGSGSKKRVTFNSNVKTYEHVSPLYESRDSLPETLKSLTDEEIEQISAKVKRSLSSSEESSIGSSVGSFPTNYRYQNCRDSDDEIEECCDDDSDLDDGDDDHGDDYLDDDDDGNGDYCAFEGQEEWSEVILSGSIELRTENLSAQHTNEEVENEAEMFLRGTNKDTGNVGVGSASLQTVLNPVENLTRWKSVNTRCESEPTPQKENRSIASETDTCLSFEPIVKRSSSNLKPKSGRYNKPTDEEVAVDASLSTWLSSGSKANGRESVCSENSSKSQSSKYTRNNLEDRPILGALTVEELKEISKYSSSSSPRKSPSRSPDEMPIIGSVGSYWNDSISEKDSRSVSSYKGIPNTNKKYSEDKKVNWHSTPFEKRLERALNQRSGDV